MPNPDLDVPVDGATGSSGVTKNRENSGTSLEHDRYLFDCDQIINLCSNIEKLEIQDQSDSMLEVRLNDLDSWFKRLQSSYEALMLSPSTANSRDFKENAKVNYNVCSETYYVARSHMLDMIRLSHGYNAPSENPRHSVIPNFSPQFLAPTSTNDNSGVFLKVPPCDTEVFKGGYEEWPSFRDMFTAVYVNHPKLSSAQKLYHLRNKTKGEAGAIVKRYPLCDNNFELAWNALKSRYDNKRVLVDKQIKILFDIPVATVENSDSIQRIHATVVDCLSMLKSLDVSIDGWDPILIHLISTKLPDNTLALWEQSLKSHRELPKWSQMDEFLNNRFEVVERISSVRITKNQTINSHPKEKIQTYLSQDKLNTLCILCEADHSIRLCPEFRKFTPQQRIDFVFKNKFCNNCLSSAHTKGSCKSKNTCIVCKKSHHTLLHMPSKFSTPPTTSGNNNNNSYDVRQSSQSARFQNDRPTTSARAQAAQIHSNFSSNDEPILLRTALVQIKHRGELYTTRALIDPGSQRTFVSEKLRNLIKLPYHKSRFEIIGIGGQSQTADKECEIEIFSPRQNFSFVINAIVLPKVTRRIPSASFKISNPEELEQLDLADPYFNQSSQIDLIIGNDSERFINLDGVMKNICGETSAYNTIFGWVLSGPIRTAQVHSFTTTVFPAQDNDLSNLVRKFWEQEEIPTSNKISAEDKFCEDFYQKTTTRQPDGRYVVRLPFKNEFPDTVYLGSSRFLALGQFSRMEQNLSKNPELQEQYKSVLNEYIDLDHMEETSSMEICTDDKYNSFYLPHHAVVRPEHKTTKVRVVFNASRKTKSGFSLNDVLHTGPTLQTDLVGTILNWRMYKYTFSGDIQKMYRQILVHPADRAYQKILHQKDKHSPIQDYQLKTVTFGINCAPFLAIRTLQQLASDSIAQYPLAASIINNETYVDDILSGGVTIEETMIKQNQLIALLSSAGFPLKKITANDERLLAHLPAEDLYDESFLHFHETSSVKTLGLHWNALTDSFSYSLPNMDQSSKVTKRKVLSLVARLYDPLGWITPIVISAKILLQQIWLEGLDWDEEVSSDSLKVWNNFISDLSHIGEISIPRHVGYKPSTLTQIHGFCDASKGAYCACVYLRCQTSQSSFVTSLLISKSKVAPLQPVSLPRLELNGAVLLSKLVQYVKTKLKLESSETILWTDASIVLGWLSKPPWTWETYVANRTAQIHERLPDAKWRHVPTADNPADLGTRGAKPMELAQNSLWWNGPAWLSKAPDMWPKSNPLTPPEPETTVQSLQVTIEENDILDRFSSYARALRVLAYVYRFYHKTHKSHKDNYHFESKNVSYTELNFVKIKLISLAQTQHYKDECNALANSRSVSGKSSLKVLNPFMDSENIMRVNGRLAQSALPYNERHPIILPGNSRLCKLYLSHLHLHLAHAECNLMCRMVQTEFYISRLKRRVKAITHNCKTCTIFRQNHCTQLMAPLPVDRCTFTPPFQTTGIDFAGPFELKSSSLRQARLIKGYVSVFVCFSTKAVHLELCSELSSSAFESAFARFVGRRGLPHRVVTDNGRNFIGASRALLREFRTFIKDSASDISQKYATHGFEWSFIPPHAPHMGGLWEAAVKSFKFHFKRIAGSHKFTFEQFSTILARIEGVLNSRPISALSEDPNDLTALTPGHFLRGAPMLALPELTSQNLSLINRWLKLKALHHDFAIRWKEDYLKALQKRYKWKNSAPNLNCGDLVVVIDDMLPPSEWRLGRIERTHTGADDRVRIADVRTSTGIITRPIAKLCYLPCNTAQDSSLH